jgi:hypothetical protein
MNINASIHKKGAKNGIGITSVMRRYYVGALRVLRTQDVNLAFLG